MLKPTDIEELKGNNSRYAVVIGVAKRAREIAEQAELDNEIIIEKPVSLAIADFKTGDYKLCIHEDEEEESAGDTESQGE